MWIRKGKITGTVVCTASEKSNLHQSYGEALHLNEQYEDVETDKQMQCGDLFVEDVVTEKLENYPVETFTDEEIRERKIQIEMYKIAEESCIEKGILERN